MGNYLTGTPIASGSGNLARDLLDELTFAYLLAWDLDLGILHTMILKFFRFIPLVAVAQVDHLPKFPFKLFLASCLQVRNAPTPGKFVLTANRCLEY